MESFLQLGAILGLLLMCSICVLSYSLYQDHVSYVRRTSGSAKASSSPASWRHSFFSNAFVSGMLSAMLVVLVGHHVCSYGVIVLTARWA